LIEQQPAFPLCFFVIAAEAPHRGLRNLRDIEGFPSG
jgi:hypothetical protein